MWEEELPKSQHQVQIWLWLLLQSRYFNPIPHGMFWDAQLTGWGQKWPPRLNSTKIFQMAQNLVHMLKNIRRANKMKI